MGFIPPPLLPPVKASGGPLEKFREGWALPPDGFVAHYYERDGVGLAVSVCGRRRDWAGRLFGAGTMRICKHCAANRQAIVEVNG